jgi:hypothetical protein
MPTYFGDPNYDALIKQGEAYWKAAERKPYDDYYNTQMERGYEKTRWAQTEAERKRKADEYYQRWIESNPLAYYNSQISGLDETMKDFYSGKYNDIYSSWQADNAKNANTSGAYKPVKWNDYLKGYNWLQKYKDATPYNNRGGYAQSSLAPRTRILNY